MTFTLDTSGKVEGLATSSPRGTPCWFWRDLSPFCQGYVEALFADLPQPDGHKATDAMRRALTALAAADGGRLAMSDFYRAMEVTNRGRYLVYERMKDRHWVENQGNSGSCSPDYIHILPWGRTALRPFAFSDLSLEALALILKDCEAFTSLLQADYNEAALRRMGGEFWICRNDSQSMTGFPTQAGWASLTRRAREFPPLTFTLSDDGKVCLMERL